jgi:hypothetical protein
MSMDGFLIEVAGMRERYSKTARSQHVKKVVTGMLLDIKFSSIPIIRS